MGKDNSKYYKPVAELPDKLEDALVPQVKAMSEMLRILKPGGKLILTLPFGKFVDYGWFINYDSRRVADLFQQVPPGNIHAEYFEYTSAGWMPCSAADLVDTAYGDRSAPAAAGLACFAVLNPVLA